MFVTSVQKDAASEATPSCGWGAEDLEGGAVRADAEHDIVVSRLLGCDMRHFEVELSGGRVHRC